ncbi:ADP-ribosylglycohydrolase family protein [Sanyastnella coralliicola]|uniref:ADP-ribosylglycohydrolase family protein n=1 Tax=Sanyastnella coralliicola TaxID=3069118 RepID=UPI0027BA1E33|nr:ADP-ribosylglycohydrolase family protein [Longitalea sp. SCSIO 12813]
MTCPAKEILFGVAISDALGVPYEFLSREQMNQDPARDVTGYGTHNQPPGTWSDDTSLTLCLAESLLDDYSLITVAEKFIQWKNEAYWSARGSVFDIGLTTSKAISRLEEIIDNRAFGKLESLKDSAEEQDNGNGALMRILPLIMEIQGQNITEQFAIVWNNAALTHRHIRSAMCCMIYLKFAEYLILGIDRAESYSRTQRDIIGLWEEINFPECEKQHFKRIIQNDISSFPRNTIKSGGYVIESLEASLWCLLNSISFEKSVLEAINLGDDTDTTGAITGGIAALHFGYDALPDYWVASLARMEDIENLSDKLNEKYASHESITNN